MFPVLSSCAQEMYNMFMVYHKMCTCFSCFALSAGSWSSSLERIFIYSHPERSRICMHLLSRCHKWASSHTRRHRGHLVLQNNRHGPFCVRTNQQEDEPPSSEDGHVMPRAQLRLICAQPWRWWWSKWWCGSFSGVGCSSRIFFFFFCPNSMKACEDGGGDGADGKNYSLLISCHPPS